MALTLDMVMRWDRDRFYRLAESGILQENERVELIEGVLIQMSPQNKRHAFVVETLNRILMLRYHETHEVRVQLPLDLSSSSQPEPDFALVPKGASRAAERHPTTADLVVEVADSSVAFDAQNKYSLYARYGIPEYWLVNLQQSALEVFREPQKDPTGVYDSSYVQRRAYTFDQEVAPLFAPDRPCSLVDLKD